MCTVRPLAGTLQPIREVGGTYLGRLSEALQPDRGRKVAACVQLGR